MKEKYSTIKRGIISLIGVSFCIAAIYLLNIRITSLEYSSEDLQQDYIAARHLVNHESIYSDIEHANYHPPLTAILLWPLSFLSYKEVIIIWTLLSIILYFITWWLIFKELNIHLPLEYLLVFLGFSFCWHPFLLNIGLGQWSILIGFCIAICWICLRHDKNLLAGIILGLACLIRLTPGLLIVYLLFSKRWKTMVTTILVVIVGTLILALIIGPEEVIYYFTTVIPHDTSIFNTYPQNYSILGFLGKYFVNGDWVKPIIISPIPINFLALILDIVMLIILIRMLNRLPNDKENNDIKFVLTIIAMFFISPVSWQHNLVLLTIPICIILKKIMNKSFNIKYGYGLIIFGIILLSLPDIQIDRILMNLTLPNRLPWYLGIGFLFYDVGLIILWFLLLPSRKAEGENNPK
jgi:hypothetical protein